MGHPRGAGRGCALETEHEISQQRARGAAEDDGAEGSSELARGEGQRVVHQYVKTTFSEGEAPRREQGTVSSPFITFTLHNDHYRRKGETVLVLSEHA